MRIEEVRSKLSPRDATLVSLLGYSGLRPFSEATRLRWEQIGDRAIRVDASKTGRTRYVELLAPLAADLVHWREESSGDGLVFPTQDGDWTENAWKLWQRRVGNQPHGKWGSVRTRERAIYGPRSPRC